MPEFILDHGSARDAQRFNKLAPFVQGYIEAMFFTSTGPDNEEEGLGEAAFGELAPEAVAKIVGECEVWQAANAALLAQAYQRRDYDEAAAGRDYWYTRNGHGVGFWDRTQLDPSGLGDLLSDAARYSSRMIYRGDDGAIYYGAG